MSRLRVVFFGTEGLFSRAPLRALLDECEVGAVVVPRAAFTAPAGEPVRRLAPPAARPHAVPLLTPPGEHTIIGLAWDAGIPVVEIDRLAGEQTLAYLRALRPDVLCVACFPRLLPRAVLHLPRYAALNLHPSLLPAYRGPAPLFWLFHRGADAAGRLHAGVTVHLMDSGADTGDIVSQAPVGWPDGTTYSRAEQICSEAGARLLAGALGAIAAGRMVARPQPRLAVPAAPLPRDGDFAISPAWPARRAFNFLRGVAAWNRPLTVCVGDERLIVRRAIAFDEQTALGDPVQRMGDHVQIQCSPGVLTIAVW